MSDRIKPEEVLTKLINHLVYCGAELVRGKLHVHGRVACGNRKDGSTIIA
jgi:hypothetical protein